MDLNIIEFKLEIRFEQFTILGVKVVLFYEPYIDSLAIPHLKFKLNVNQN